MSISRTYSHVNNESYIIALSGVYNGKFSFQQLTGAVNSQRITKIRVAYVDKEDYKVQIYYSGTTNAEIVRANGIGEGIFINDLVLEEPEGTKVEFPLKSMNYTSTAALPLDDAPMIMDVPEKETHDNEEAVTAEAEE